MSENIYTKNGYESRAAYHKSLSEEYCVELSAVEALADILGESEAFDGLVSGMDELMEMESYNEGGSL